MQRRIETLLNQFPVLRREHHQAVGGQHRFAGTPPGFDDGGIVSPLHDFLSEAQISFVAEAFHASVQRLPHGRRFLPGFPPE